MKSITITMNEAKKVSDSRLKEIAGYDVNFDDDIPEFTDEQLAKFARQNNKRDEESIISSDCGSEGQKFESSVSISVF